ncbi:YezD family protein [Paenibacillus sp. ACRRX]|uniref:YezD family protein n=1 Tax=unclassified Paenibacillus TaxID=185978 RepID=UPI001EF434B5|nr:MULTISPECIES: YezD family protein [unclassified Paenibacillus]MCG7405791.1 YezD family protein [Paenibacillus sp. ACRRX]MDK8182236.1 YezD family protein [Paenibacillus sp. UMB4589-SE434]
MSSLPSFQGGHHNPIQNLQTEELIWLERIATHLRDLQFGTIQIVVHNGQIVQIEKTERHRYDVHESIPAYKEKGATTHAKRKR